MKLIDRLMDARPNSPEGDRLDVLVTLVEAWEEKHWPIDSPDPVEAILFAMEHRGLSRRDLEPLIGSRARVAEVLNHKRSLNPADDPSPTRRTGNSGGSADRRKRRRLTLEYISQSSAGSEVFAFLGLRHASR